MGFCQRSIIGATYLFLSFDKYGNTINIPKTEMVERSAMTKEIIKQMRKIIQLLILAKMCSLAFGKVAPAPTVSNLDALKTLEKVAEVNYTTKLNKEVDLAIYKNKDRGGYLKVIRYVQVFGEPKRRKENIDLVANVKLSQKQMKEISKRLLSSKLNSLSLLTRHERSMTNKMGLTSAVLKYKSKGRQQVLFFRVRDAKLRFKSNKAILGEEKALGIIEFEVFIDKLILMAGIGSL